MEQIENDLIASFDALANRYDEETSTISHYIIENTDKRNLEWVLKNKVFHRTLDAGGGTGKWIPFLQGYSKEILLFDISQNSINIAKEKYRDKYNNVEYVCGNLEKTHFDNESIDFIFAQGGALSYTPNPLVFLAEQHRILKPKGLLWLECYSSFGWAVECEYLEWKKQFAAVTRDLVFSMPDWDYPARMFNIEYIRQEIQRLHFTLIQDFGSGILLNTIPRRERDKINKQDADAVIDIEVQLSRTKECKAVGIKIHMLLEKQFK